METKDLIKRGCGLLLAAVMILATTASADARRGYRGQRGPVGPGGGMGPGNDPAIMKKMDTIKLVKLVDILGLDEKGAVKLAAIFKKHREKTIELHSKLKGIATEVQQNLAQGLKEGKVELGPRTKKIIALVKSYQLMKKRLHEQREEMNGDILEILDPVQQGKYIVFQQSFPKQLRRDIRDFRNKRMKKGGTGRNRGPAQPNFGQ